MKVKSVKEATKNTYLKDGDYKSTKELFERVAKISPDAKVLANLKSGVKEKIIEYHTAKEVLEDIEKIGNAFLKLGFKDNHIAILADNCYEYVITDMAIVGGVGVVTPIDKDANCELLTFLLNKCEADVVVCSSFEIVKLEKIKNEVLKLKNIITLDKKIGEYLYLKDLMDNENLKENEYRNIELDLDKTCQLLFTSGTTGPNKLVEISQRNMAANIANCLDSIKAANSGNVSMSVLPMHHATEINTHILPRIATAVLTCINDSMKTLLENIKVFKPTLITVVPMIANMFYKGIWASAKKSGMDAKLKKGIKLCGLLRKFGIDITHKLLKDVFAPFGGNLKQIVCGGAALNPEVVKGFSDLGVFIVNGYGITECGPLVSMNTDTLNEVYSIGQACPKLEVKVVNPDENGVGELCVKGDSVAKGYYKDEKATKEAFDEEGFFHTGDYARIDKKGRIFLSGRKKNTIVLENGKNVYPEEIETEIENSMDYIKEVVVYEGLVDFGNNKRKVLCAGVFLGSENNATNEKIKADFIALNQKLSVYKRINYVDVVDSEYEKTSTRKIKREPASLRHTEDKGIII